MHRAIYERLKAVARAGATITYGEIAPLAHVNLDSPADRNELAAILGNISQHEHAQGRPLLSAVVVYSDDSTPGKGFYTMAHELDVYHGTDQIADLTLFVNELRRVHDYWQHAATERTV